MNFEYPSIFIFNSLAMFISQRIYATAWETPTQLEIYNFRQAEAKRRDHRLIGKALDLFSLQEDAGGGLVFWHAKGAVIRRLIEDYWKQKHIEVSFATFSTLLSVLYLQKL